MPNRRGRKSFAHLEKIIAIAMFTAHLRHALDHAQVAVTRVEQATASIPQRPVQTYANVGPVTTTFAPGLVMCRLAGRVLVKSVYGPKSLSDILKRLESVRDNVQDIEVFGVVKPDGTA